MNKIKLNLTVKCCQNTQEDTSYSESERELSFFRPPTTWLVKCSIKLKLLRSNVCPHVCTFLHACKTRDCEEINAAAWWIRACVCQLSPRTDTLTPSYVHVCRLTHTHVLLWNNIYSKGTRCMRPNLFLFELYDIACWRSCVCVWSKLTVASIPLILILTFSILSTDSWRKTTVLIRLTTHT